MGIFVYCVRKPVLCVRCAATPLLERTSAGLTTKPTVRLGTLRKSHNHKQISTCGGACGGAGRAGVQNGDWAKVPGCARCFVWTTETVLTPFPCSVPLLTEGAAKSLARRRRQDGEQEVGRDNRDLTPHCLLLSGASVPGSGVWGLANTEGRT